MIYTGIRLYAPPANKPIPAHTPQVRVVRRMPHRVALPRVGHDGDHRHPDLPDDRWDRDHRHRRLWAGEGGVREVAARRLVGRSGRGVHVLFVLCAVWETFRGQLCTWNGGGEV